MITQNQADEIIRKRTQNDFELGAMEEMTQLPKAYLFWFDCGTVLAVCKKTGTVATAHPAK